MRLQVRCCNRQIPVVPSMLLLSFLVAGLWWGASSVAQVREGAGRAEDTTQPLCLCGKLRAAEESTDEMGNLVLPNRQAHHTVAGMAVGSVAIAKITRKERRPRPVLPYRQGELVQPGFHDPAIGELRGCRRRRAQRSGSGGRRRGPRGSKPAARRSEKRAVGIESRARARS